MGCARPSAQHVADNVKRASTWPRSPGTRAGKVHMHQAAPYTPPHRATRSPSRGPRDAVLVVRGGPGNRAAMGGTRHLEVVPEPVAAPLPRTPTRNSAASPPLSRGSRRQRTMAAHKRSHRAWGREATRAPSGQRRALNPHRHSSRMAPRPGRGRHARISCRPDTGVRMGGGAVEASSPGTEGMRSMRCYRLARPESIGLKRGQRGKASASSPALFR